MIRRVYVDLADVVGHATAHLPPGRVTLLTDIAEAPTSGNPVLLERLEQNLVENGLKYNLDEGGWVRVVTFHRSDSARLAASAGSGLGLSIVRAVTKAHDGDARAEARPDGALRVTVVLPAAD